jgi:hypothetical protein
MYKNLLFLILIIMLSGSVYADCTENACSGTGKDVLLSVYPNPAGDIYLQAGSGRNNLDCELVSGHFMTLKKSHPAFKEIYSTILTALAAQKHLSVRIVNGSSGCEVSYVRMYM